MEMTNEDVDSQADLLLKRLAGADCIRRVKPGGLVVRVEYSYGSRLECDDAHMALDRLVEWCDTGGSRPWAVVAVHAG